MTWLLSTCIVSGAFCYACMSFELIFICFCRSRSRHGRISDVTPWTGRSPWPLGLGMGRPRRPRARRVARRRNSDLSECLGSPCLFVGLYLLPVYVGNKIVLTVAFRDFCLMSDCFGCLNLARDGVNQRIHEKEICPVLERNLASTKVIFLLR